MKATLGVRLPDDIEARLNTLAETTGRSKSYYAREAIIKHLEELEDVYLAEKRPGAYTQRQGTYSFS